MNMGMQAAADNAAATTPHPTQWSSSMHLVTKSPPPLPHSRRLHVSAVARYAGIIPCPRSGHRDVEGRSRPHLRAGQRSRPRTIRPRSAELKVLADTHQHADVYSLMGFSLRKTGDYPTALTFYKKALDFDANHKGAREYLGELYVETGDLPKAREQLAVLEKLCPQGCEEREDLEKALASAPAKTN